jgi:hypothetical protein
MISNKVRLRFLRNALSICCGFFFPALVPLALPSTQDSESLFSFIEEREDVHSLYVHLTCQIFGSKPDVVEAVLYLNKYKTNVSTVIFL